VGTQPCATSKAASTAAVGDLSFLCLGFGSSMATRWAHNPVPHQKQHQQLLLETSPSCALDLALAWPPGGHTSPSCALDLPGHTSPSCALDLALAWPPGGHTTLCHIKSSINSCCWRPLLPVRFACARACVVRYPRLDLALTR